MLKRISFFIAASLVIALLVPFVAGCDSDSTDDEAAIATRVAKEWTADSMGTIADEITDLAMGLALGVSGIPGISDVLSSAVEQQIADNITWTYSTPLKTGDSKYEVVAKASSGIDLPAVGTYGLSVNFPLIINTEDEEVTDWTLDTDSFDFTDTGSESTASLSIEFEGWFVDSSEVTTAGKSDTVTAILSLSDGDTGTYTIRIIRDVNWADDETVTDLSFNHDGRSTTKEVSFTPPYATGESSTNGYLVHLLSGDNTIWTMTDDYPPRLTVSS